MSAATPPTCSRRRSRSPRSARRARSWGRWSSASRPTRRPQFGAPRAWLAAPLLFARDAPILARMSNDPLVARAREAALRAYAPYSRFNVGAAVESVDGEIVLGANME